MSTSPNHSRGVSRHFGSQNPPRQSQNVSVARRSPVGHHDAYTYALRVAYLAYLLQPRARRTQSAPVHRPPVSRSSTSFHDLMRELSLVRDSKSTRLPHGFVS